MLDELLTQLEYKDSQSFLRADQAGAFSQTIDYGHILRRSVSHCHLKGVYSLHQGDAAGRDTVVPLVYVCETKDDDDAERIHRLVWNQDIVPFLIVVSQKTIRLYSGFRYDRPGSDPKGPEQGLLKAADTLHQAMTFLDSFRSSRIDEGTIWDEWGRTVTPETRVDWSLLSKLNDLDSWLQGNGLDPEISHSLIGKYVYLYYLRHRDILSDRKLARWGLEEGQIFSRNATLNAFWSVVEKLDDWLNGSAFVLQRSKHPGLTESHLKKVAGTFRGDDPASGQLALDFGIYDFAFIPIETLSVIYEQFLHAPSAQGLSTGKQSGAYYTPIPLVNFMLEELDSHHPFRTGMRVLDPACGSGAFLVQCYRRIIEQDEEFISGQPMQPTRLLDLLESHIFGIDRDGDACRVAELSLSLTLLDYVDPPDLESESTPKFQLPKLHDKNIFEGDFFAKNASWRGALKEVKFDWIVGNPPWIELKSGRIDDRDKPVWEWLQDPQNQPKFPTGGNQVAEAFAWKVADHLAEGGFVGLLLPAMTLFKDESAAFRKAFFRDLKVRSVANFSNLAYVLFPGHKRRVNGKIKTFRSERPAAGFFYSKKSSENGDPPIWVFSPLVADQPANRPSVHQGRQRQNIWTIIVAANQVQAVAMNEASSGSLLPWKLAMWGSHLDSRLLVAVSRKCAAFRDFCSRRNLEVGQGFELRTTEAAETLEPLPELANYYEFKTSQVVKAGRVFDFPASSLRRIPPERCYVRKRSGLTVPLKVSKPPHIIVDKLRRFAIYSDEYIAVPPRQIGIAGDDSQKDLLKALSLYLVSDFAIYHQFLLSPEWGISTSISTLETLRQLPVPLGELSPDELRDWASLHATLVQAAHHGSDHFAASSPSSERPLKDLLSELNDRVYELLGLRPDQRVLVSDLVNIRMKLIKGKTPKDLIRKPTEGELRGYAQQLKDELDAFTEDQPALKHRVSVGKGGHYGIVSVTIDEGSSEDHPIEIIDISRAGDGAFRLADGPIKTRHNQWVYFERNVRLYEPEGNATYVFKPYEKLHWTGTQAQLDASTIISETLTT